MTFTHSTPRTHSIRPSHDALQPQPMLRDLQSRFACIDRLLLCRACSSNNLSRPGQQHTSTFGTQRAPCSCYSKQTPHMATWTHSVLQQDRRANKTHTDLSTQHAASATNVAVRSQQPRSTRFTAAAAKLCARRTQLETLSWSITRERGGLTQQQAATLQPQLVETTRETPQRHDNRTHHITHACTSTPKGLRVWRCHPNQRPTPCRHPSRCGLNQACSTVHESHPDELAW